jgi:hypothetical protein
MELRVEEDGIFVVGSRRRQAFVAGDEFVVRAEHEIVDRVVFVRAQHLDRLWRQIELDCPPSRARSCAAAASVSLTSAWSKAARSGTTPPRSRARRRLRAASCERSDQDQQQAAANRHAAGALRRSAIHATDSSSR